jgi:ankyrin repeat protein
MNDRWELLGKPMLTARDLKPSELRSYLGGIKVGHRISCRAIPSPAPHIRDNIQFIYSCFNGKMDVVKFLVANATQYDIDIHTKNYEGSNGLIMASYNGHASIVKLLVDAGLDVNLRTKDNSTALTCAAHSGRTEVMKVLCEAGADVNVNTRHGWTALASASFHGHLEMVEILLHYGAELDVKNSNGSTAVQLAAFHGHLECLKKLVAKGADLEIPNDNGATPLALAVTRGANDIIQVLIDGGAKLDKLTKDGHSHVVQALNLKHVETARLLARYKVALNMQNRKGFTAIMWSVSEFKIIPEYVKLLMEKDPSLDIKSITLDTALMLASDKGHTDAVKLLVANKASLDLQNTKGQTALILAANNGHMNVCAILVENGASLDLQAKDGSTALIAASKAAMYGHIVTAKMLLKNGAAPDIQDWQGYTALMYASRSPQHGRGEVIKALLQHGASVHVRSVIPTETFTNIFDPSPPIGATNVTAFMLAADKGNIDTCKVLLTEGADLDAFGADGRTSLIFATQKILHDVVEFLLLAGANVNARAENGLTPFLVAVRSTNQRMVDLLLTRNVNFDCSFEGKDLLQWAEEVITTPVPQPFSLHTHTLASRGIVNDPRAILKQLQTEKLWRRRRYWVMFASALRKADPTPPQDIRPQEEALFQEHIIRLIASYL